MDWLLRPVVRGFVSFESLLNGTVDLAHIALLNDAIDLNDHNQKLYEDSITRK